VPFVWGTVGRNGNPGFTGTGADADRLSQRMMDAWIAFAKTGDPSHPGIGKWPAYSSGTRPTMIFGAECGVRNAPFEEERALWESML
jgi:para-nitrobenzyl esterase